MQEHLIPILDDILQDMREAKIFMKADKEKYSMDVAKFPEKSSLTW